MAVVTNVHPAHLAGFGSLEAIVREKTSIAEGLADDGVFLIHGDIEILTDACRRMRRACRTFGRSEAVDYRAEQITHTGLTSRFSIQGTPIELPLPGPGNVDNAVAAWAVCEPFGLTLDDFASAVRTLSGVAMRAETMQIGTLTVLNDCYNASPASMRNALAILTSLKADRQTKQHRRTVFICGHMAELGAESESLHAQLGIDIARAGLDVLITVGEPTKATAAAARQAAPRDLNVVSFDDTASLCDNLESFVTDYDLILVKGSRAARLETVVQELIKDYG